MHRTTAPTLPPAMGPITQHHLLHAYLIIRPIGVSFEAAMAKPAHNPLRRVIEFKAGLLRAQAAKAARRSIHKNRPCQHPLRAGSYQISSNKT